MKSLALPNARRPGTSGQWTRALGGGHSWERAIVSGECATTLGAIPLYRVAIEFPVAEAALCVIGSAIAGPRVVVVDTLARSNGCFLPGKQISSLP